MEINDSLILLSLTQSEINAISSPTESAIVYNSDTHTVQTYNGSTWENSTITTTTDIPEGTNLYYTDARVAANSAVVLNTAKNSYPLTDANKVGFLTVTGTIDLDTIKTDVNTNNNKITNATHTGEVTGNTSLTVQPSIISNKPTVTAASGMIALLLDGGVLKQADVSAFFASGGLNYLETATLDTGAIITPPELSNDAHNYNPTGFSSCVIIRQSIQSNGKKITGFVAPSAGVNRIIAVNNISPNNRDIRFENNDSNSSANNRLLLRDYQDKTIRPNETAIFWYDHISNRWRPYNRIG